MAIIFNSRKPVLIAITGGSGSGKSFVAEYFCQKLGTRAWSCRLDDFYRDRSGLSVQRRKQINYDHPRAIDWELFEQVLRKLARGQSVNLPVYDFASHTRRAEVREFSPAPFIFVEGLWLLRRRKIRECFDFALFLDCPPRMRLKRRLKRDVACRGRDAASIRKQFRCTVEPMHRRYVAPQRRWADVVLPANRTRSQLDRILRRLQDSHGEPGAPLTAERSAR